MEQYLGKEIPKLGFGLMRLPKNGEAIDVEQTKEMVDLFLQAGFNYFDTSWGYIGSEDAAREALVKRHPRDSYLLATKCPAWAAKSEEKAKKMFSMSLERTGAGYFDFYLLHNLGESRSHFFDDYGIWDFLAEKKAEGLIRHLGFSFHDKAEELDKILTAHPEMEFVQLQINYADWEDPYVESGKCYEVARKHGKPVIIMEPVKGGTLAALPEEAETIFREADPEASPSSWAIRYAASLDGVITVLSGMSDVAQMKDNISFMRDFKPLTEQDYETIARVKKVLDSCHTVPCTACGYCMEGCPKSVAIYGTFQAVNIYNRYQDLKGARGKYIWNTNGHGWAKASECIGCGACEEVCPQHISIRDELSKAAEILEE